MAAAHKPRNGKREYTDAEVKRALWLLKRGYKQSAVAAGMGIPRNTIRTWKYGPRGQRVTCQKNSQ